MAVNSKDRTILFLSQCIGSTKQKEHQDNDYDMIILSH